MKNMEQDFEKILNKLVASTRSPRGKFSKANSWILLEKRLPRLQRRILSLRTMASAAAVAVLCVLGWWAYYMFAPVPLQTVSTLAETRSITLPDQTEIVLNRYSTLTYPERFRGKTGKYSCRVKLTSKSVRMRHTLSRWRPKRL